MLLSILLTKYSSPDNKRTAFTVQEMCRSDALSSDEDAYSAHLDAVKRQATPLRLPQFPSHAHSYPAGLHPALLALPSIAAQQNLLLQGLPCLWQQSYAAQLAKASAEYVSRIRDTSANLYEPHLHPALHEQTLRQTQREPCLHPSFRDHSANKRLHEHSPYSRPHDPYLPRSDHSPHKKLFHRHQHRYSTTASRGHSPINSQTSSTSGSPSPTVLPKDVKKSTLSSSPLNVERLCGNSVREPTSRAACPAASTLTSPVATPFATPRVATHITPRTTPTGTPSISPVANFTHNIGNIQKMVTDLS